MHAANSGTFLFLSDGATVEACDQRNQVQSQVQQSSSEQEADERRLSLQSYITEVDSIPFPRQPPILTRSTSNSNLSPAAYLEPVLEVQLPPKSATDCYQTLLESRDEEYTSIYNSACKLIPSKPDTREAERDGESCKSDLVHAELHKTRRNFLPVPTTMPTEVAAKTTHGLQPIKKPVETKITPANNEASLYLIQVEPETVNACTKNVHPSPTNVIKANVARLPPRKPKWNGLNQGDKSADNGVAKLLLCEDPSNLVNIQNTREGERDVESTKSAESFRSGLRTRGSLPIPTNATVAKTILPLKVESPEPIKKVATKTAPGNNEESLYLNLEPETVNSCTKNVHPSPSNVINKANAARLPSRKPKLAEVNSLNQGDKSTDKGVAKLLLCEDPSNHVNIQNTREGAEPDGKSTKSAGSFHAEHKTRDSLPIPTASGVAKSLLCEDVSNHVNIRIQNTAQPSKCGNRSPPRELPAQMQCQASKGRKLPPRGALQDQLSSVHPQSAPPRTDVVPSAAQNGRAEAKDPTDRDYENVWEESDYGNTCT